MIDHLFIQGEWRKKWSVPLFQWRAFIDTLRGGEAIQSPSIPVHVFLLFSRTLAFFTILAEGVFILALARVLFGWSREKMGKSGYILPGLLFLGLFVLLFAGEYLCGLIIDLERGYRLLMYRVVVWDLMATLYALLEGVICILAARVYLGLKRSGRAGWRMPEGPDGLIRPVWAMPEVWLVTALFLVLFGWFEYMAVKTALDHHLGSRGILNMARFFRIVTGWCWTTFEALVAVILIKIYLLMNQGKAAS